MARTNYSIIAIAFVLLLSTMLLTFGLSEPTPTTTIITHNNNNNGNNNIQRITLHGEDCAEIFNHIFDGSTITSPTSLSFNLQDTFIEAPFENLEWYNITDVSVDLSFDRCEISKDIHGYQVEMNVDGIIDGNFSYLFEFIVPDVIADDGKFSTKFKNATIVARVDHFGPTFNNFDELINYMDTPLTTRRNNNNNNNNNDNNNNNHNYLRKSIWEADVLTFIPNQLDTVFYQTDFAHIYNNLAKEHELELRTLLSLITNAQVKSFCEDYCNNSEKCDDSNTDNFFNQIIDHQYPEFVEANNDNIDENDMIYDINNDIDTENDINDNNGDSNENDINDMNDDDNDDDDDDDDESY